MDFDLGSQMVAAGTTAVDCGDLAWGRIEDSHRRPTSGPDGRTTALDPFRDRPDHGGRSPLLERVLGLIGDKDFQDAIVLQGFAGSGKCSTSGTFWRAASASREAGCGLPRS